MQPVASDPSNLSEAARTIFAKTLERLDLRTAVRSKVRVGGTTVRIDTADYHLAQFQSILLIAVGKAARPMAEGLLELLDAASLTGPRVRGIVVGTSLPVGGDPRLSYRIGSHPLPDGASLDHARLILEFLMGADEGTLVFFLISGGASAMVELPAEDRWSLEELVDFYQGLIHSGLPIAEMNTLRKHISAVKGGRLAVAASGATQCTLLVSDVRPQQPEIVGSGLSMPDGSTLADCKRILAGLPPGSLPSGISEALARGSLQETPKANHPAFARASFHMLLSSDDLCAAAQTVAQELGFRAVVDLTCDEWDYREGARYLLDRLDAIAAQGKPVCLISAGELSVCVHGTPGIGGRNQQFALECARQLAGREARIAVLSAGSDGVDGNSPAAGAVVDSFTVQRAHALGFNVEATLAGFDAFTLLNTLGESLMTGPSGNNLRDLRCLLRFG